MDEKGTAVEKQSTPGIGVGGIMMCPYFKGPCLKSGCELWVELKCGEHMVGRCAHAWVPITTVEFREEVLRIVEGGKNATT